MKVNVMGLLSQAGQSCEKRGDSHLSYGLYELANNLRLVMVGEETIEQFREAYTGADRAPFDLDALFPPEREPTAAERKRADEEGLG